MTVTAVAAPLPQRTLTVLIVDDHQLIRSGLRRSFDAEPGLEVTQEASSGAEALAATRAREVDVVVLDIGLPDINGIEVARQIRALRPHTGIVMLTMYDGDDYLFRALEAGASAFVSKSAPAAETIAAVRHAAASPQTFAAANLAAAMQRKIAAPPVKFTPREVEILTMLQGGVPVATIARRLFISLSTAKSHISRIYEKLGVDNRTRAVLEAMRLGVLEREA